MFFHTIMNTNRFYSPRRFFVSGRRVKRGVVLGDTVGGVASGIGPNVCGIRVGKLANFGLEAGGLDVLGALSGLGVALFSDSFISMESFSDPSSSTSILWLSVGKTGEGVSWIGVGVGKGILDASLSSCYGLVIYKINEPA